MENGKLPSGRNFGLHDCGQHGFCASPGRLYQKFINLIGQAQSPDPLSATWHDMREELKEDMKICASHLLSLRKKRFVKCKSTYYDTLVKTNETDLNFLVSVTVSSENIILGFHPNANYNLIQEPTLEKDRQGNITNITIVSKDENCVKFINLDFNANYFLFADKLAHGIAYYSTNARRDIDSHVTKGRWLFREEYRCVE